MAGADDNSVVCLIRGAPSILIVGRDIDGALFRDLPRLDIRSELLPCFYFDRSEEGGVVIGLVSVRPDSRRGAASPTDIDGRAF